MIELTEAEISKRKMFELPIQAIKYIDPFKGLSFRVGQPLTINSVELKLSEIVRDVVDGEVIYMVFAKDKEGIESLIKYSSGIPVYITLDIK